MSRKRPVEEAPPAAGTPMPSVERIATYIAIGRLHVAANSGEYLPPGACCPDHVFDAPEAPLSVPMDEE